MSTWNTTTGSEKNLPIKRGTNMQQKDPGKDPLAEKLLESGIAYKGSFL